MQCVSTALSLVILVGGRALLMDPVRLAKLIIDRITELKTVTYDELLARANEKNIEQGVFNNAMQRVHKKKTVLVKDIKGVLTYSIKPVEVAATPSHVEWCKANYPYPGVDGIPEFVMPFPEWDVSYIFLTPDELEEYKEAIRGGRVYKRKKWEYGKTV